MRKLLFIIIALPLFTMLGCESMPSQHDEDRAAALNRWQDVRVQMALDLAQQQMEAGDLAAAQQAVMGALEIDSESVPAQLLLGQIYIEQDRLQIAHRCFENCLAVEPDNGTALYNLGIIYERWSDLSRAFESYMAAYNTDNNNSSYVLALADMYARTDQPDQALGLLDNLMARSGPQVPLLVAAGNILTTQGHHDQAILRFRQALQVGGENPHVSELLAYALFADGRVAPALAIFENLENQNSDDNQNDYNIVKGQCYLQLGNLHQAMRAFEQATRNQPQNINAWVQLAQVYLATDNTVLARDSIRTAQLLAPNNPEVLMVSGYISLKDNDYPNAVNAFRQVVAIDSNYALAHYLLGISLQGAGRPDLAANSYQRALTINPNDQLAQQRLASLR
ncbi:MAG: tetratricopeptide repeat protein [Sedimentisphaerales bacterium]|nr:tetratricopeptide repeat protein [Sedimentisphaerales bacterium]